MINFHLATKVLFWFYLKLDLKKTFTSLSNNFKRKYSKLYFKLFFVSVSDINDEKLSNDGYSITISTHSKSDILGRFNKR